MDFYDKALNVWKSIAPAESIKKINFEIDLHRQVLSLFQVGNSYYFVFNVNRGEFDYISPEIKSILGYNPENTTAEDFLNNIHEDDRPYFIAFEEKLSNFFRSLELEQIPDYKIQYDFRIKSKAGDYKQILHQMIIIQYDDNKNLLYSLGVHSDISHIKFGGAPKLSFINLNKGPSYLNIPVSQMLTPPVKSIFSKREKEILRLLISGKNTAEISDLLHISAHTVNSHRKKILEKSQCKSLVELGAKSIQEAWA